MNPNDLGPLGGMLGPMLQGMQQRAEEMKQKAASTQVEGSAGGDLVKVVMTCDHNIVSISIGDAAMDDREMLEDLIRAATNEALRKVAEHTAGNLRNLAGGLPIPPGLIPGM